MKLPMYYYLCLTITIFTCLGCITKKTNGKYVIHKTNWINGEYFLVDSRGDTIKKLEKHDYSISFTGYFDRFAIFGITGVRSWPAIDIHENILFTVGNFPPGDPLAPDYLVEDRIRIIDDSGKIGFANSKGKIVIKPQFELVTRFNNGFAIIQAECYKIYSDDEGDDIDHDEHDDCNHYGILCNKLGYIDKKGKIIKLGNYSFEELQKEIGWKD